MQATTTAAAHTAHDAHEHEHPDQGFLRTYVFSTDHKVIGIQYGVTSLVFLFIGFILIALMRWQLAYPGEAIPLVGGLLEKVLGDVAAGGVMSGDLYNSFGAMHGTIKRLPQEQQALFRLNLVYEREGDLEMPNALDHILDLLRESPSDGVA